MPIPPNQLRLNVIAHRVGHSEEDLAALIRLLPGAPIIIIKGRIYANLHDFVEYLAANNIALLCDPGLDDAPEEGMEADDDKMDDETEDGGDDDDDDLSGNNREDLGGSASPASRSHHPRQESRRGSRR